jgi:DNA-binding GntR family transcriptional regulator
MLNIFTELDRKSYKPLYVQLAESIIDYANESHLKNGDALPSENDLLSRFAVSRNTIRLAVDRLVQLGVAQKLRGQGTFFIKKKRNLSVHYHRAFEGSVERTGLKVTNKLIDKKKVSGRVRWIDELGSTHWDETVLIRRIKSAAKELLALEERLLPGFVVRRFSQEEIENNNISPDLVEKYPDTKTSRFNYIFISQPLTKEESVLLKLPQGTHFLRRIGEYYNSIDERFMISRVTIISDRINLRYEYVKQKAGWVVRG